MVDKFEGQVNASSSGNHLIYGEQDSDFITAGAAVLVPGVSPAVRVGSEIYGGDGIDIITVAAGNHLIYGDQDGDAITARRIGHLFVPQGVVQNQHGGAHLRI